MQKTSRNRLAVRLIVASAILLACGSAFAQPARPGMPTEIAAEWRLESNEDPGQIGGQGQPALGYYLGIPFNDAGRMRADTSAESHLGNTGIPVQAALGSAPMARTGWRTHP